MRTSLVTTVEDVEQYMDRFRTVFHSWHFEPDAGHRWANVFPVVEQLLEGPTFESIHCPAACVVEGALLEELASRVGSRSPVA